MGWGAPGNPAHCQTRRGVSVPLLTERWDPEREGGQLTPDFRDRCGPEGRGSFGGGGASGLLASCRCLDHRRFKALSLAHERGWPLIYNLTPFPYRQNERESGTHGGVGGADLQPHPPLPQLSQTVLLVVSRDVEPVPQEWGWEGHLWKVS